MWRVIVFDESGELARKDYELLPEAERVMRLAAINGMSADIIDLSKEGSE
jgi:hypothetical protein